MEAETVGSRMFSAGISGSHIFGTPVGKASYNEKHEFGRAYACIVEGCVPDAALERNFRLTPVDSRRATRTRRPCRTRELWPTAASRAVICINA